MACNCFKPGRAWRHGPHQVAQKSRMVILPALRLDPLPPWISGAFSPAAIGARGIFSSSKMRTALACALFFARARRATSPSDAGWSTCIALFCRIVGAWAAFAGVGAELKDAGGAGGLV